MKLSGIAAQVGSQPPQDVIGRTDSGVGLTAHSGRFAAPKLSRRNSIGVRHCGRGWMLSRRGDGLSCPKLRPGVVRKRIP